MSRREREEERSALELVSDLVGAFVDLVAAAVTALFDWNPED